MDRPATVEEYIAKQPIQAQPRLHELRAAVRAALPEAAEVISYGMPTYRMQKSFVSFGAAKHHCALYGAPLDLFPDELHPYKTLKGTVQFPLDQPVPQDLVCKLVRAKFSSGPGPAAPTR
jgi:uncharacterized protein YdhG (YjbR/CyaY superfamily)